MGNFCPPGYCPKRLSLAIRPLKSSVPVLAPSKIGPCIKAIYWETLGKYSIVLCIGSLISTTSPFFHALSMDTKEEGWLE